MATKSAKKAAAKKVVADPPSNVSKPKMIDVKDHMTGEVRPMRQKQYELLMNNKLERNGRSIYRYTVGNAVKEVKEETPSQSE